MTKQNDLLSAVLEAHGGLDRWRDVTSIKANLSLGGPFWGARGWPDVYSNQTITLNPHHEEITFTPFTGVDRVSTLTVDPERVTITTADGIVEERLLPRSTFPTNFDPIGTPWDAIQVAYFTSAAVWNYLTAPFVFTHAGVETHEIDPWNEHGETWRRLAVTFPKSIANHNADQVFYFDDDFMQRRMDYSPDVTGNPPVAHYSYDHKLFGGFAFATRRRVLLHDEAGIADHTFAPITLDVESISVQRAPVTVG